MFSFQICVQKSVSTEIQIALPTTYISLARYHCWDIGSNARVKIIGTLFQNSQSDFSLITYLYARYVNSFKHLNQFVRKNIQVSRFLLLSGRAISRAERLSLNIRIFSRSNGSQVLFVDLKIKIIAMFKFFVYFNCFGDN